jgi:glucose-6-phosphate 1-dehydrogenase
MEPFIFVIFGGTGDLSLRKLLPALFHLYQEREFPDDFSILSVARASLNDEEYRLRVSEALRRGGGGFPKSEWESFAGHLFYLQGDLGKEESCLRLRAKMETQPLRSSAGTKEIIFYLALPPQTTRAVVEQLRIHMRERKSWNLRVIVEKPFGRDLSSARQLNQALTDLFPENRIYRIDHYLGKETVQNIIFFRFSNSIFEQLWNRRYIDHVQITVAEELGVENRAAYYETAGVIRDMVQNHLLQILALVAMEPPIGFAPDLIRDEKVKVFRSFQPMEGRDLERFTVLGQYGEGEIQGERVPAYREEKGVSPHSNTPTFFAAQFFIANWRWAGVPFYLRTGKRLEKRLTEIAIVFEQPPLRLFGRSCDVLEPNVLFLTIQPDEKISLRFGVKYPYAANQISTIHMTFCYEETFQIKYFPAYERLLLDCLRQDPTLFVREDQIEAMWEIVDPIIARWERNPPRNFPNYAAGTWGPAEADRLLEKDGRRWITSL